MHEISLASSTPDLEVKLKVIITEPGEDSGGLGVTSAWVQQGNRGPAAAL